MYILDQIKTIFFYLFGKFQMKVHIVSSQEASEHYQSSTYMITNNKVSTKFNEFIKQKAHQAESQSY